MTTINYCWKWSRHHKESLQPYSAPEAREAYDARTLHTALIGDKERPTAFVECDLGYIGMEFLDSHLRVKVTYQFQERRPGMLFLSMAVFREFDGDQDKVTNAVVYYFKEDGNCTVHKVDVAADLTQEATPKLDVSANWEPYPKFGEYESISRLDRGLDLIH